MLPAALTKRLMTRVRMLPHTHRMHRIRYLIRYRMLPTSYAPHAGLPAGLTKRLMTRVAAMLDGGDGSDVLWWVLEEAGPAQASGLDYTALLRAYRCASDAHAAAALRTGIRRRIRCMRYAVCCAIRRIRCMRGRIQHTAYRYTPPHTMRCAQVYAAAYAPAYTACARGQRWGAC